MSARVHYARGDMLIIQYPKDRRIYSLSVKFSSLYRAWEVLECRITVLDTSRELHAESWMMPREDLHAAIDA